MIYFLLQGDYEIKICDSFPKNCWKFLSTMRKTIKLVRENYRKIICAKINPKIFIELTYIFYV